MTSYKVKKKKDQERYETPETIDKPTGIVITTWTSTCTGPLLHRKLDIKKVKRFLTDDGKANSNTVVSNDGNRAVRGTPTAGKKRFRGNVNVLSFQQYQMLKENYSREG